MGVCLRQLSLYHYLVTSIVVVFQVEQVVLVDQEKLLHFLQRMMPQIYAGTKQLTGNSVDTINAQDCLNPAGEGIPL